MTQPLRSSIFRWVLHYYELLRPCASHWYSLPSKVSSVGILPSHRDDRFPRSLKEPEMGSHRLHAGHRAARKQVSSALIPSQQRCSVLMSVSCLSTRHQQFTCVCLPISHLTPSKGAFSSTLTTRALYPSSSTRFETWSCNPISRGQTLISSRASPYGVRGTPLSQQFPFRLILGMIPW